MTALPSGKDDVLHPEQMAQEDEYYLPYHHLSAFAPSFRSGFVDSWAMNYNHSVEFVLEQVDQIDPSSVVDIGSGDGRITTEIGKRFRGKRNVGIDFSARAIALAKLMDPEGSYEAVDITNQDFADTFELGLLIEVFEHIPPKDAEQFVRGVARLIAKGGQLLVTVPHINKPVEYKHFRHFDSTTLIDCFSAYFVQEEIMFIEKLGLLNRILNKLVVNRLFVLNLNWALNALYRIYGKYVFRASSESECARIAVLFRRNSREA